MTSGNRTRNNTIDSHVLAAIQGGATRAAAVRKALAGPLEAALIWSDTWRRAGSLDPAEEAEEAARRGRDIDRSLKRLRNRGLIRHRCPDWEVTA